MLGPDLVKSVIDKVQLIRQRLLASQSRQKAYADNRYQELEISVGDHMFLCVSLMKGVLRFGKGGKLSSRYIGPYEILGRVGRLHIA